MSRVVLVRYSIYRSIAILAKVRYRYLVVSRYFDTFGIERPLFDTFDTFDTYDTFDISILDIRVHSTMSMRRRNIVVDDDVVYGSYHYSASQPKLTKAWLFKNNIT